MKKSQTIRFRRSGFSILFVMAVLAAIAMMATLVLGLSRSNVRMSGYYRWEQGARYSSLGMIEYVKAAIENDLKAGLLDFDTAVNSMLAVNYEAPPGYDVDPVTNITLLADGEALMFAVRGREMDSQVEMEAVFKRRNLLGEIGLFGDKLFNAQPNAEVYSYRSSIHSIPLTPSMSTGEAGVGSNEGFAMPGGNATIDGTVFGGLDEAGNPPSPPSGYTYEALGERVEPDPLGIRGGSYAEYLSFYSVGANNDNAQVSKISNNRLSLGNNDVVSVPSGDYYLTDIDIKGTLIINGTPDDPVYFWLDGPMIVMPQGEIVSQGSRPVLRIFSRADDELRIQPNQPGNSHLLVWIYAPYAQVTLQPNNDTYGAAWGRSIVLRPNNTYYIDVDLLNEYKSYTLELVSLKELRQ